MAKSTRTLQRDRIFRFMRDGRWHNHESIARKARSNWASASARVRDMRKVQYGGHEVQRKPNRANPGFFLYRMIPRGCGVLLLACLFVLCGCDAPASRAPESSVTFNGNRVTAPAGSTFSVESEEDVGAGMNHHEGSASGVGAGLSTESEKVGQSFDASAPRAWLPGAGAEGGATSIKQTLTGGSQASPLMWAGILTALGGGVAFYFNLRRAAFVCWGMGAAFITAAMIPQWAFIIIGFAGVVCIAFLIYAERKGQTASELARSFVWAREELPPAERAAYDARLAGQLETRGTVNDAKTLGAIKAKEGIV